MEGKVEGSLEKLGHKTCGEIYDIEFKHLKYKRNYSFVIPPHYAHKIYELLLVKPSGRRFIINR